VISKFSGLRANCAQGSYQIRFNDGARGIISLNGIRSTGFTASIAIADFVIDGLQTHCGVRMSQKNDHRVSRPEEARPGWVEPRPFMSIENMKKHSEYGSMVCFCEQISKQEIINTLSSPLSPRTLDSIKRRTRALMGRCQGYNCQIAIAEIISKHSGIPFHHITKKGPGSEIFLHKNVDQRLQR
jgi:glycerol-3-phosphate dehydrogenase